MDEKIVTALLVAKVLAADGIMQGTEKARLSQLMEELGLSDAQQEQVLTFEGMDDAIEAARQLPEEQRQAILDRLADAALVDGELSPHELSEIKALSAVLAP